MNDFESTMNPVPGSSPNTLQALKLAELMSSVPADTSAQQTITITSKSDVRDFEARLYDVHWDKVVYLVGMLFLLLIAILTSLQLEETRRLGDPFYSGGIVVLYLCGIGMIIVSALLLPFDPHIPAFSSSRSNPQVEKPKLTAVQIGPRLVIFFIALFLSWSASLLVNEELTPLVILSWIASIMLWAILLNDDPRKLLERAIRIAAWLREPRMSIRFTWVALGLLLIILLGAWLRFSNLSSHPYNPSSDHYEELLSVRHILNGNMPVFFPFGGREVAHFYFAAILQKITGWQVTFDLIKLTSGLEGLFLIPLAFWMSKTLLEHESPGLQNTVALSMAFLVSTEFWPLLVSRDGLREVTVCYPALLVLTFLTRALRYNRRGDFLAAGLFLGTGFYTYSASRALPIFVVIGFVLALITLLRHRSRHDLRSVLTNMAALVLISVVVFIPIGTYALQHPDLYWTRATNTILGNDTDVLSNSSNLLSYINSHFAEFSNNLARGVLLYNWLGDSRQTYGTGQGDPILGPVTGSLFILGLGLIVARIIRRRDPGDWLLPILIFVGLIPDALAVGLDEGPSMFRILLTLPAVLYIASVMLGTIITVVRSYISWVWLRYGIYLLFSILLIFEFSVSYTNYFIKAHNFQLVLLPAQEAARIVSDFNRLNDTDTNSFLIYVGGWLPPQTVAMETGDIDAITGISTPFSMQSFYETITTTAGTPREFRPDRQILFVVSGSDNETWNVLKAAFPYGTSYDVQTELDANHFKVFIVPAVGCDWVLRNTDAVLEICDSSTNGWQD